MEKQLVIEGSNLESLIVFLKREEKQLKKHDKSLPFKYKAEIDKEDDEEQAVDIIALILSGMAGAIGKTIIDYLASRAGVDMTIKVKNEKGDECSFVLKNRTLAELKQFLIENGFIAPQTTEEENLTK